jgi:hypothetical protein
MKYASRARNIKNKPVINRDPKSAKISSLEEKVKHLKQKILGYKKLCKDNGIEVKGGLDMNIELQMETTSVN